MATDRSQFTTIDNNKTDEDKAFYSSRAWTQASKQYRINNPLCVQCKRNGWITPVVLVHHNPDRRVIIARGDSPFDNKFFESLCQSCHNKELSKRQVDNSNSIDIVLGNQINVFKG
jgi:5-methylcytosine-specific restriction protein A